MRIPVTLKGRSNERGAFPQDMLQGLLGLFVGATASAVIFWLAMFSAGAGHGSYFPYIVFIFPLNYGLAVWPLIGMFVRLQRYGWTAYAAGLILVSYLTAAAYHVFVYLEFLESDAEPPYNLFTLLAVVAWLGAVVQSFRVVLLRLRHGTKH